MTFMHAVVRRFVAGLALVLLSATAWAKETVVDMPTRPGVTQRVLYSEPDGGSKVRAIAVLMAGGLGNLRIYPNGSLGGADRSLLARTRGLLNQQGIATLLVDAPSDKRGGVGAFRHTPEHAADVGTAIAWARERNAGVPVWLVGHSRGTESAASASLKLGASPAGPDGIVLVASILVPSKSAEDQAVTQFPIEQLRVPLLAIHHDGDDCSVTPPRDLATLREKLPSGARAAVVVLTGGRPIGGGCAPEGTHGLGGLDQVFVQAVAEFVLQ